MNARLSMTCSCGAGEPYSDEDLALTDAPFIRTWVAAHQAPGHTITATVVADYEPDAHPLTLMGAARNLTRLAGALFRLS